MNIHPERHLSIATIAILLALAGCGTGEAPPSSSADSGADRVASTRTSPPDTPSAVRGTGDTAGLTQRTGVPFEPVHPTRDTLPLLLIMRNLERNMVAVQAGIWRGNHDVIQEAARAMAEHAKIPPREIDRIRSALGKEGLKGFVAADRHWHEKATELARVAGQRDMDRIVRVTTDLLRRCSSCHLEYRKPLRASSEW